VAFTQDFFTSYRDYNDGSTRIGHRNRLWYDSETNTIRVSDGTTPGGLIVSGGGSNSNPSNSLISLDNQHTATLDNTGTFTIPGPLVFATDNTRQITAYTGQSSGSDTVVSITVTMQLSESWQDTGITGTTLNSGTWLVQLYANDISAGGHNINEYYSGVMSWYNGPTDSNQELPTDEIQLHRTGASQDGGLYLRTLRSAHYTYLSLQIFSNTATHGNANYVFTFRKML
jgi:hypothetical protein